MCYGMLCEHEDHMGNCTWRGGWPYPCPSRPDPKESQTITCPNCGSENVTSSSKGSRRFVDGEVDDNIEEIGLCLNCFEEVPPPEPELDYSKLHSAEDLPF